MSCGVGICKQGTLQCPGAGTALVCTGFTGPGTETCNGADDNCDGQVDNVPGSGTALTSANRPLKAQ